MRVEEIPEQGRYPLLVAHLQGEKAFGSDILSFASAEDRERFKESRNRNLVVRFIEVKGRNSDRGAVLLMDNQYRAASDNRERFYIYRVYEPEPGNFELAILADPLACNYQPALTIDLAQQASTQRWEVREIGEADAAGDTG